MHLKRKLLMALTAAATILPAACTMMEDSREDCPEGLYVSFVYDYNIDRADMFRDQVGALTLYVFDANDQIVLTQELQRPASDLPIPTIYYQDDRRYQMHLTLPAGQYRLLALAQQLPYNQLISQSGAKFRRRNTSPATHTDVGIILDRSDTPDSLGHYEVPQQGIPLDTLWVGRLSGYSIPDTAMTTGRFITDNNYLRVEDERPTFATVKMVRDMNELHVSLHSTNPADSVLSHNDYEVSITNASGRIDWDNSVLHDDTLTYKPYASWTTRASDSTTLDINEQAAHYDFTLPRLIYSPVAADNAVMNIRNRATGHTIAQINLTHLLSQGRTHPQLTLYSPQEFLDREHRYHLDLVVIGSGDDERLNYLTLSISILGWSKRIQYEIL